MKLLATKYDRIILDTAPTQAVADALVLSTYIDNMIYVVKCDATHTNIINTGIGRLLQVGCNIAGVVLNQVDLEESARYDNNLGYYDHYGYQPEQQDKLKEDSIADKVAVNRAPATPTVTQTSTTKTKSLLEDDNGLAPPPKV